MDSFLKETWGLLLVAVVLVILSLSFSAAESAFLSINKLRLRFLHGKKDKRAIRVSRLLKHRERLINTLLVANEIVNIILSAIIASLSTKKFGNAGVGIATFIATMILLVFGEITPKTIATHHPEPIAFFFSGFVQVVEIVLTPVVLVLTKFCNLILGIFKITPKKKTVTFTQEEIKTFIQVGGEEGILEKNEKTMMNRAFKFSDLDARDIMIPRKKINAISIDAKYKDIIEQSERFFLSRFPVYRKDIDDIVGILYIKDLLFYRSEEGEFKVSDFMRPPLFILETKKMSSVQRMLRENRQSMAVVIDEYSGTSGILTSEDIAREIFGPITDEYKPYARKVGVQIRNERNSDIDGQSRLVDLNEQLNINLESRYCETIGGYIAEKLGRIPKVGDTVRAQDFVWSVIKMDDKRVAKVHLRSEKRESEEDAE